MATVSSDISNKLIAWVAAGVGSLIAYSAIKNRFPWDVLRDIQGQPIHTPTSHAASGSSPDPTANFSASIPRIRQIANREIPPELVFIKPSGQLDKDAAAALARAQTRVGRDFGNTSAYRSFAAQAAAYYSPANKTLSDGSKRFADPRKSLHVVGLAIDLIMPDETIKSAMLNEGWQQARSSAEPWHFSYLVRG